MSDVEAIVCLLGKVAGMQSTIAQRRRELVSGLCTIVECDAWVWLHERYDEHSAQAVPFSALDGGFATEADKSDYLTASLNPALQELYAPAFRQIVDRKISHFTWTREQILPPELVGRMELAVYARTGRYEPALWSIYRLSESTLSAVGLLRKRGAPAPGDRERAIVHLMLSQIDWLHRAHTDVPANHDRLLELSARQRDVLMRLLAGDARKQIATRLKISPNTVADYLKSVYRHFGVNSRGELLSKFVSGGMA